MCWGGTWLKQSKGLIKGGCVGLKVRPWDRIGMMQTKRSFLELLEMNRAV